MKKKTKQVKETRKTSSQLSLGNLDISEDRPKLNKPKKSPAKRSTPGASPKTALKSKPAERSKEVAHPVERPTEITKPVERPKEATKPTKTRPRRSNAESMATQQREISVSEFFTKNRHLLGFDNPAKALLTTDKEAEDNSLDACEEAGILPALRVEIREITDDRYHVTVEDNGPGIVKPQIPKIFGKLLYGSKFHRLKQSRGQQGIGISAAGMYGQLTTGKPVVITSKTSANRPANQFEIVLNTRKNTPDIVSERELEWQVEHGTRVEIELQGTYKGGRRSVDEYLEQVAIANPHAELIYAPPKGRPPLHLPRASHELPLESSEIKPHPYGVELGMLMKLLKESKNRTVTSTLQQDFSRVTSRVADLICEGAGIRPKASPRTLTLPEIERIYRAIPKVKIMAPQTNCVVPIGEELIRKGLEREINADLYVSSTRPPSVYRGNPFRVEVGLAYGGSLRSVVDSETDEILAVKTEDKAQGPITLIRFANRVPLQYQQSACAIFRSTVEMNWKQYGLSQGRGALPMGPMVLLVHFASVWVPFTSESKEAIAHYPDIIKEIKLALRDCGRKLAAYLRHRERVRMDAKRRSIFELYIGELVLSLSSLTSANPVPLQKKLQKMAQQHTVGEAVSEEAGITPGEADALVEEGSNGAGTSGKDAVGVKKDKGQSRAKKKTTGHNKPASRKRSRDHGEVA